MTEAFLDMEAGAAVRHADFGITVHPVLLNRGHCWIWRFSVLCMDLTRRAEQGDEHQAATYDFLHAPASTS